MSTHRVIGGDLFSYIVREGALTDGVSKIIAYQLFLALEVSLLIDRILTAHRRAVLARRDEDFPSRYSIRQMPEISDLNLMPRQTSR